MSVSYHDGPTDIDLDMTARVRQANVGYHDAMADEYESDPSTALIFTPQAQARIKAAIEFLGRVTKGHLFIDVGCGTGNVLKFAREAFDRTVGVDISSGMLSVAKGRGLDVCSSDALTLPVASASADAISCFSVLHHLYRHKPYLAEFYRALKPGGYLYTDFDPNSACLLRQPFVLHVVRFIYPYLISLRFGRRQREGPRLDQQGDNLQELAEYHQNYTSGLDHAALWRDLTVVGFREVGIYYHFSVLSLPRPKAVLVPVRLRRWVSPFLAVVAKK